MSAVNRIRRWMALPVAAAVVLLLLLLAVSAGLRVPGLSYVSGIPGLGGLDYRTVAGGSYAPLRASYIDELLGTELAQRASRPASAATGAGSPLTAPQGAAPEVSTAGAEDRPAPVDHEFTNDDMATPVVIRTLPFAGRTDSSKATRQTGEPESCAPSGGTAWYRYRAPRDGRLFADTFGSDHATAIGVFSGSSPAELQPVACAQATTGSTRLGFPSVRGRTYYFQVASVVRGGRLVFNLMALGKTTAGSLVTPDRPMAHEANWPAISGDGRIVAFQTQGAVPDCGEVPSQACPVRHVYVTDRRTNRTTIVSRTPAGAPANGDSYAATVSEDGRYVGYTSEASDIVPGDTNRGQDFFVHELATGRTVRASVHTDGDQSNGTGAGLGGYLSADGRYATFFTNQGGLVDGDGPGTFDVFVRDLRAGVTTIESVDPNGNPAGEVSLESRISRDGRYLAFLSSSRKLAPARYGDCGSGAAATVSSADCLNVFVRDRALGTTRIVSMDPKRRADMAADRLDLSTDGRVVAWTSTSTMGDDRDTNGVSDVFVVRLPDGKPHRVSVTSTGEQQDDPGGAGTATETAFGFAPSGRFVDLSGDGKRVAFDSRATNLVSGDTNAKMDVFVRDLTAGWTLRVSVTSAGDEADGDSYRPALSRTGALIVFESDATNLASGDDNNVSDVYVHDMTGA
ncbi:MAG TPA: hypothetical protein VNA30_07430 [Mycobacteriales bacterium]|nr:hypothetical protein [Mycobacteriales bacterium]